jgi:Arc/MetJ family transcription regulator
MPMHSGGISAPEGRSWGEPPHEYAHDARALAEQLLEYAEVFAREGDPSAACAQARVALDGLETLARARPFVDDALRDLLERARLELGLYEAQWAEWQQKNDERQSTFSVHERLALKRVEGYDVPAVEARPRFGPPPLRVVRPGERGLS